MRDRPCAECDTAVHGCRVRAELREEYVSPAGRRACSYRLTFSRSLPATVSKTEIGLWQARMREALQVTESARACSYSSASC